MPRSEDPGEFLLNFLFRHWVVTHIPEDVGKISIGKQCRYEVIESNNPGET